MSKYTAEQYRTEAAFAELRGDGSYTRDMLLQAAATLEQQAEWPSDADANVFLDLYEGPRSHPRSIAHIEKVRAALQSVRTPADNPCSLSESLNVIERWAMRGNTLQGDDADRLRALTDKIAAPAKPDAGVVTREDCERAVDARIALLCDKGNANVSDNDLARAMLESFASRHARQVQDVERSDVWVVQDETGQPIHCASWPMACHEHINDAINEHGIHEARAWKVLHYSNSETVSTAASKHCDRGPDDCVQCSVLAGTFAVKSAAPPAPEKD